MDPLVALAWRTVAWVRGETATPPSQSPLPRVTLLDLPDPAAEALLSFLDTCSLRVVALCTRDALPPLADAFRRRVVLRVPPDAARNTVLMRAIAPIPRAGDDMAVVPTRAVRQPLCALASQFAVADTVHAVELLPVRDDVRGLVVSSNKYTAWPARAFQWDVVVQFTALERLVIEHAWYRPLDFELLSQSCPRLQELVVKGAQAVVQPKRPLELPLLRVLHLEDANAVSCDLAVGLEKLESLTLLNSLQDGSYPLHIGYLERVAPLRRLVVRGAAVVCLRSHMARHNETLREYAELGDITDSRYRYSDGDDLRGPRQWPHMVHLRSLRLGWEYQSDMAPFAALQMLEHLQLVVASTCTDCVPLRRLTRLRTLHITNGWVCDLVGYLPRLEKLVWEWDRTWAYGVERTSLWRRRHAQESLDSPSGNDGASQLRTLVIRGDLRIQDDSPSVEALLRCVEQLEICDNSNARLLLPTLSRLRRLKRLSFQNSELPWVSQVRGRRRLALACADTLEELFYMPLKFYKSDTTRPAAPLPLWFSNGLPNLRVLASPLQESMTALAELCPRLTHVRLPFSTHCAFPLTNKTSLARLCEVTLALKYDCAWLRAERGLGRGLPLLQRIYHPTTDCLSSAAYCERYNRGKHGAWLGRDEYIMRKALRAPWCYDWHTLTGRIHFRDSFYETVGIDKDYSFRVPTDA